MLGRTKFDLLCTGVWNAPYAMAILTRQDRGVNDKHPFIRLRGKLLLEFAFTVIGIHPGRRLEAGTAPELDSFSYWTRDLF